MTRKILISLGIWAMLFAGGLFAENNIPADKKSDPVAVDLNKVILPYSIGANLYWKLPDGTAFKTSQVRALARTVPENSSLLKQEKIWSIAMYTLSALALGSAISGFIVDGYNVKTALVCSAVGTSVGAIYAGAFAINRLQHAVNNYNLSVMGIPIRR